jgi:hypothetical protein
MLQPSPKVYGALAIALMLGAVPLAAGRDLAGGAQLLLGATASAAAPASGINREAKADRSAAIARSQVATRTISLQLNGLTDTSVLVRMPVANGARNGSFAPSLIKSGGGKPTVACEPVVSVLTEVAKLLQPGRCIT